MVEYFLALRVQVPNDFNERHEFENVLELPELSLKGGKGAPAMQPTPPDDAHKKKAIDSLASFVARNGPAFENLAKSRHRTDTRFEFLFGGAGEVCCVPVPASLRKCCIT